VAQNRGIISQKESDAAPSGEGLESLGARPGTVYLVGGGPGDPGLVTVRGAELIASADVILHDELVHPALLDGARPGAEVRAVGKRGGDQASKQAKQEAISADLVALAKKDLRVVRLKGGDPFLFGRGSEEASALAAAGVPFEIVPGVISPLAAAAYAGISLTHRDLASSVTLVSGTTREGAGFAFRELAGLKGTVCVLMGMHDIERITAGLIEDAGRDPATPAAVVQWGTRAEQRVALGRLDQIAAIARAEGLGSPAVIIVGEVVSLRGSLRWFDAWPLFGKRVLITRPREQAAAVARLVRRRGGEAVLWPAIAIGPPPDPALAARAAREVDGFDVVVFTSENGVSRFWRGLLEAGRDARALGRARVAAIGPGTAAALRERGITADIVPGVYRGEALAEAILSDPIIASELKARACAPGFGAARGPIVSDARSSAGGAPLRVLIPRALVAREVLAERLREAGCEVSVVPVYETRPAPPEAQEELRRRVREGSVDVVLLTSSSTADSLADALGAEAPKLLRGVLVASIGPITTATAEKRGLSVGVTAEESTTPGLVEAVERHLAKDAGSARSFQR
jgi:uroporphyrinogen III methyltransferase/synthase